MKIKDIMTKDVLTVPVDGPIDQVVGILTDHRIHGIPVVDGEKLVGIITEDDFFSKKSLGFDLLSYLELVKANKPVGKMTKEDKEQVQKIITSSAKDIMTGDCVTVSPEDEVEKLVEIFRNAGFSSIPVVDENCVLRGIITRSDVIKTIRL